MDAILTASTDGAVRIWTMKGVHIGTLGQADEWDVTDSSTFSPYPADVAKAKDDDPNDPERIALRNRESDLKSLAIRKFRCISPWFEKITSL